MSTVTAEKLQNIAIRISRSVATWDRLQYDQAISELLTLAAELPDASQDFQPSPINAGPSTAKPTTHKIPLELLEGKTMKEWDALGYSVQKGAKVIARDPDNTPRFGRESVTPKQRQGHAQ